MGTNKIPEEWNHIASNAKRGSMNSFEHLSILEKRRLIVFWVIMLVGLSSITYHIDFVANRLFGNIIAYFIDAVAIFGLIAVITKTLND